MNRKYLLDTSIVVDLLRQRFTLEEILPADAETHLCDVVVGELLYGARRSAQPETQLDLVRRFVARYTSLSSDLQVAEIYARVKSDLDQRGQRVADHDVWIAAHAIRHGMVLITRDKDFGRLASVSGFQLMLIDSL